MVHHPPLKLIIQIKHVNQALNRSPEAHPFCSNLWTPLSFPLYQPSLPTITPQMHWRESPCLSNHSHTHTVISLNHSALLGQYLGECQAADDILKAKASANGGIVHRRSEGYLGKETQTFSPLFYLLQLTLLTVKERFLSPFRSWNLWILIAFWFHFGSFGCFSSYKRQR